MRGPLRAPIAAVLALAVVALAGCGMSSGGGGSGGRMTVVATTTQLQDFARNVGGARIDLHGLLRPNVDPHDYEPTPGDAAAVARAKVLIVNGVGLDSWVEGVRKAAGADPDVVTAADRVPLRSGDAALPEGDPHIWLDPRNAERMVRNVERGLTAADPAGAATYHANAARYLARLRALDRSLAAEIAPIPPSRRLIVTDHDAFGYLAARYGLRIVGTVIPSLSTAAEPDARAITRLADTIRKNHVHAVFAEASVDPRVERAIAAEAGARLGGRLYGDSLGPAGGPAATYVGMMRTNMAAIVGAIQGG